MVSIVLEDIGNLVSGKTALYLVDIDAVFLHVVPVINLSSVSKFHGQDPLCGQIPVNRGNLWEIKVQKVTKKPKCSLCLQM